VYGGIMKKLTVGQSLLENDTIKNMINELAKKFNVDIDESMVLFCALLAKLYFMKEFDKYYEKRIDHLITGQIGPRIPYSKVDDQYLQRLEKEMEEILGNGSIDIAISVYDKIVDREFRKLFGKFYTPLPLVDHILESIELNKKPDGKIIDLACGSGVFLSACIKRILNHSSPEDKSLFNRVIDQIYGIDVDENACSLTKLNLLVATFRLWKNLIAEREKPEIDFRIYCRNSLGRLELLAILKGEKFDFVIGNPPYVEAKRLPKKDKLICRINFPDVARGAFDIYVCFIKLGLALLRESGYLGYVLPDKFLVTKYAYFVRKKILDDHRLIEICDISNLRYFKGTDVYPILLTVKNEKPNEKKVRVICNLASRNIFESKKFDFVRIEQEKYKLFESLPFYCLENELDKEIFFKILANVKNRLSDFLHLKTTVSFHFKGLRERFVCKDLESPNKFKYLGGKSYSRKNEVDAYKVEWEGYFINYDIEALKKLNNPLPPICNFIRPKIIFCQHAKRMLAYCDFKGEWITKDVYPIAFIKGTEDLRRTYYYTGFLNSNIFSYLYGIIYKGIQISEGYFHFLPAYLSVIPTPNENESVIAKVSDAVERIQESRGKNIPLQEEINRIFYNIFGLSEMEIERVEEYNRQYLSK